MDAKLSGGTDRARALALFAAVVEQGSFSAAGRVLDMSPSAVSRAIDRIEARLGVRLLLRSTRALSLTAEGQTYLQTARRILADLDDAEQQIADQGSPRGRLRVTAALSHGRLCVVPLLGKFVALYPDILVDIALNDALVDIAAGQADVAVRFGPLPDSALTARKLGETGRVIVASPEYLRQHGAPEVPEDLHRHNCLNFKFRRGASLAVPTRRSGVQLNGKRQHRGQQRRDTGAACCRGSRDRAGWSIQRVRRNRRRALGATAGDVQSRRRRADSCPLRRWREHARPRPSIR
jgi:DNA-binding transcriptional LysR family regulator